MSDFQDATDPVEYARRKRAKAGRVPRFVIYTLVAIVLCCDGTAIMGGLMIWLSPPDPSLG